MFHMLCFMPKRLTALPAWLLVLAAAVALLLPTLPVQAQITRLFPQGTERGQIHFEREARVVRVDGKLERLGPGVEIRDESGRAPRVGTLAGQKFLAHYARDASGAIFRIWLLTPQEARKPAPDNHRRRGWRAEPEPFRYLN